ncbi:hypothetical protein GCM10029978_097230 [Actinoallomurus acanthiterrae]
MADGGLKPVGEIKVGDKVANAVPGDDGKSEEHRVEKVIVTKTDRDFVDLTIATHDEHGRPGWAGKLTTTEHHPFYDITQAAFVDAAQLKPGDRLQEPGGRTAEVLDVRRYTATATTYDLTVGGLHTYYVLAGAASVLVHNCGTEQPRGADGRFATNPDAVEPGQPGPDGLLRGTNATGQVTSRGSFRAATEDGASNNAETGPNGGRLCPTQGPNCAGEVMVPPRTPNVQRDWDVSHNPSWTNIRFPPSVSRQEVLDNYHEGTGLECIPCNRGGGNDDSRFER